MAVNMIRTPAMPSPAIGCCRGRCWSVCARDRELLFTILVLVELHVCELGEGRADTARPFLDNLRTIMACSDPSWRAAQGSPEPVASGQNRERPAIRLVEREAQRL